MALTKKQKIGIGIGIGAAVIGIGYWIYTLVAKKKPVVPAGSQAAPVVSPTKVPPPKNPVIPPNTSSGITPTGYYVIIAKGTGTMKNTTNPSITDKNFQSDDILGWYVGEDDNGMSFSPFNTTDVFYAPYNGNYTLVQDIDAAYAFDLGKKGNINAVWKTFDIPNVAKITAIDNANKLSEPFKTPALIAANQLPDTIRDTITAPFDATDPNWANVGLSGIRGLLGYVPNSGRMPVLMGARY